MFKSLHLWVTNDSHIYLVDDICDTGDTLKELINMFKSVNEEANITSVVLINRATHKNKDITPDIYAFDCPLKDFLIFEPTVYCSDI